MRELLPAVIACLAAYLIGSIPFGLLVARLRGVDIRTVGSGNIGATNVFRCIGKKWGILVFVMDFLKGFISAGLLPLLLEKHEIAPAEIPLILAALAVAGHNWPIWLRFKGGKGIATSAGALLGVAPVAVGMAAAVWLAAFFLLRYVSVASLLAALTVGIAPWTPLLPDASPWLRAVLGLLALAAIIRHRANIKRLCQGNENRFSFRKKETA